VCYKRFMAAPSSWIQTLPLMWLFETLSQI
jgi:hypothetical protein